MTVAAALAIASSAFAQNPPAANPDPNDQIRVAQEAVAAGQRAAREAVERDQRSIVPLRVEVVLTKYQDGKLVSTLPYELTLSSDNVRAGIRMGAQVPVQQSIPGGDNAGKLFNYQRIGTNIDGQARPLDNGRYALSLTIEDTSVVPSEATTTPPTLRDYRSTNGLILRDGQSAQFTAATDKVTGEELRAQVTLTVVK
jgi:hypothetical protein